MWFAFEDKLCFVNPNYPLCITSLTWFCHLSFSGNGGRGKKKKKKKPCRDCSKLHLPKQTELLWLSRIVAEMQQWYFPSMLPPIQRKVGGKSYLLSNAGILTSVHMWRKKNKHFSVSIMRGVLKPLCGPFFQVVNMPSEAQRTSHQSKNVPADVRPGYLPMSSGILFILVGTEG